MGICGDLVCAEGRGFSIQPKNTTVEGIFLDEK
jgi:hypothetical protein